MKETVFKLRSGICISNRSDKTPEHLAFLIMQLSTLARSFQTSSYSSLAHLSLLDPGPSHSTHSQLFLSVTLSLPFRDNQMLLNLIDDFVIFVVLAFLHVAVGFVLQRWNGSVRRWLEESFLFVRRAKPRFKK